MQNTSLPFKFKPIGGATWILQIDNLKIACDPVLLPKGHVHHFTWFKSKRLEEPEYEATDFDGIDLWLLTHNHEDHLDESGLEMIDHETELIIHRNLNNRLQGYRSTILKHNKIVKFNIKGFHITVEAIPAIHGVIPIVAQLAGGVNGYWLTVEKEAKCLQIYVSSDTVYKPKVAKSLKGRKADIYIPNVGAACKGWAMGTLTLSAKMLKKFMDIVKPDVTLPVHFGTFSHYNEPISEVEKLNLPGVKVLKAGEIYHSNI